MDEEYKDTKEDSNLTENANHYSIQTINCEQKKPKIATGTEFDRSDVNKF